jgi:hypothetical protein
VKVVFVLVFGVQFKRGLNRSNSESAASEIVGFCFHILFGKVIIDYIFHCHGHSRSLVIVCLLTVKIY